VPLFCLVAAGVLLLAAALAPTHRGAPLALALVTPLAAVLVWSCLSQHRVEGSLGPLGGARITLDAVALPLASGGAVRIGGDPQADDVVVGAAASPGAPPRLAPGAVRLVRQGGLAARVDPAAVAVAVVGRDIVGARPVAAGWRVCALPCAALSPAVRPVAGAVYDAGRFALTAPDGAVTPIPAGALVLGAPAPCDPGAGAGASGVALMIRDRQAPDSRPLGAGVHSLCVYAGPGPDAAPPPSAPPAGAGPGADLICGARLLACRQVALDGGRAAALPVDGPSLAARVLCGVVGGCLRAPAPLRLVRLERFEVADDGRTVTLGFPDPPQRLFTPASGEGITPGIRLGAAAALDQPVAPAEKPAVFERLGHAFDAVDQVLVDPPTRRGERPVVHAPAGLAGGAGARVVVGRGAGAPAAVFDIRTLDFDHGFYGALRLLAVLALGASLAATWSLRRADPLAGVVFAALDLFLALRLACAVEGAFMDGAPSVQAFPSSALPELALGPLALLLVWPGAPRRWAGAGILGATALLLAWISGATLTVFIAAAALLALAGVALAAQTPAIAGRMRALAGVADRHPLAWLAAGSGAMLLARLGFGFGLDWREAAHLGPVRVAMSLLFVPAILVAFAPLLADLRRGGVTLRAPARSVLVFGVVGLALGIFAPSVVVKDFGFAIFAWPVVTGVLIAWLARAPSRTSAIDLLLALAVAALALLVIERLALAGDWRLTAVAALAAAGLAGAVLVRRPAALWAAPALLVALVSLLIAAVGAFGPLQTTTFGLHEAVDTDVNRDRLLAAFAPGEIQSVGTAAAEAYANTLAAMRDYSHPLLGRGFLSAPEPTLLKAYQLTDNAAAIHLMSPFGRLGALGLLLAAAAVALAAVSRALQAPAASGPWLGVLAALTPWLIDAYMILANNGVALFTGRNVYLLSPASISDFLEALVLLGVVGVTLGRVPP
jgi:hypothetical protein